MVHMKLSDTLNGEYGELKSQVIKKIKSPAIDAEVKRIISAYKEVLSFYNYWELKGDKRELIENLIERKTEMKYSAEGITCASTHLSQLEKEEYFSNTIGIFLSTLIQKHFFIHPNEKKYTLITETYQNKYLRFFCSDVNVSEIIVYGNVGNFSGRRMRGGKLSVMGNAENYLGDEMENGEITVNGTAGMTLGTNMKNGTIIVNGNVGSSCGYKMEGGTIHCKSNAESLVGNCMRNGKIIIQGNAEMMLGTEMHDGIIEVYGNCGFDIGERMTGGKIFLHNTYESISKKIYGGEIYHKGKRIR